MQFFALAIWTLARVFRAKCDSDGNAPLSRQQGVRGRAPLAGHCTSCALLFIANSVQPISAPSRNRDSNRLRNGDTSIVGN